ncbi:hypothetical protein [Mammaliicoccus sciuri]|uniref:hypothetical protein n=1 Tax=Mammaliicoccus sciuri TaxID=1296 RepID=UPI001E359F21|nr:hypothetical protein [Mammaliicoccus sciuri]MCD8795323.1 hypothetical protein [Mammaliicoccus sciuri]MEB7782295.1 hypothetical protein [Mammaliicoccus sciuri]
MTIDINENDLVAVICEGKVEEYIISILLERKVLIFGEEQLLDDELLPGKLRHGEYFKDKYLTSSHGKKIVILIIADKKDKQGQLKISEDFMFQVKSINYILTRPEIEMLMILKLGLKDDYYKVKQSKKPSLYLKEKVDKKIKSEKFVRKFYEEHDIIECIDLYSKNSQKEKNIHELKDLLR